MRSGQWEIHAAYGGLSAGDLAKIMGDEKLNPFTQAELLAAALAMPFKETGRDHYRALIQDGDGRGPYERVQVADGLAWLEKLGIERSPWDGFELLPPYSFALDLRFQLDRPYLSRDDDAFYIIDNPVRKDKVFKVPLVAATSWKGSLRAAATRRLLSAIGALVPGEPPVDQTEREGLLEQLWAQRVRLVVLFGNEKPNDADFINRWLAPRLFPQEGGETSEDQAGRLKKQVGQLDKAFTTHLVDNGCRTEKVEGRQGRLFFFPTFFDKIDLEMINPHDRQRRVGKNPILFECAPAGATGTFRLLYVPYDFPGGVTPDEAALRKQVQADLARVADAVHDMLLVYGFGAKTSSGFGAVDRQHVAGEMRFNVLSEGPETGQGPSESLVRRLLMGHPLEHRLHDQFFVDGQLVLVPDEEIKRQPWKGKIKADYRKVKPRVEELLAEQPAGPSHLARPVRDLDRLPDVARELAGEMGGRA